ncbi:MAG: hypothetical protein ACYSU0_02735 [Planctomycetota bacterium]
MIELPDLPEGSAVRVIRGRKQTRVRWRSRGGFSVVLGVHSGLLSLPFVIAGFVIAESTGHKEIGLAGIGVALVVAFGLYRWLGGNYATMILRADSLTFVAPAAPVVPEITIGPVGGPPPNLETADRIRWEALRRALKKRKRRSVPRSEVTRVQSLAHEGGGVAVETRARTHRFGRDLGTEDSDWLAEVLYLWRKGAA